MRRWLGFALIFLVCACSDDESPAPGSPDAGNGRQVCADIDALFQPLATQLSCNKPFTKDECDLVLGNRPHCESLFRAMYDCGKLIPSSEWRCTTGELESRPNCATEVQAATDCALPDGG